MSPLFHCRMLMFDPPLQDYEFMYVDVQSTFDCVSEYPIFDIRFILASFWNHIWMSMSNAHKIMQFFECVSVSHCPIHILQWCSMRIECRCPIYIYNAYLWVDVRYLYAGFSMRIYILMPDSQFRIPECVSERCCPIHICKLLNVYLNVDVRSTLVK